MDTKQKKTAGTQRRQTTGSTAAKKRTAASAARKPAAASASKKRTASSAAKRRTSQTTTRKQTAQEVVYTPPKPFNRGQLLLRLVTVVAVVLAITFGISIFFKVEEVRVSGAEKYDAWTIMEASGIQKGDNLLTFGKAKACGKITANLPYVESVRIGIKLPNTVNIEIKELDVVYSIKDSTGAWWLITSEGRVVEQVDSATAGNYTQIQGIALKNPASGKAGVAQEPAAQVDEEGNVIPVTVLGSQRLDAALSIVQFMEKHSVIGEVTTVDVSDYGDIELWYGQQYQVKLGDITRLDEKIDKMKKAVASLEEYESGTIDVSFTIMPDRVMFTRFS